MPPYMPPWRPTEQRPGGDGGGIPAIPDFIVVFTTHCRVYDVVFVTVSRQRDSQHCRELFVARSATCVLSA